MQKPPAAHCRHFKTKERCWTFFNNGSIRGVHRCQRVVVKSRPGQSLAVDTVAVFTISRAVAIIATLFLATILALLAAACVSPRALKGGQAGTSIIRPGRSHVATLTQPENPKEPSRQTVQSEETVDFVLPAGTAVSLGDPPSDRLSALCPGTNAAPAAGSAALAAGSRQRRPGSISFRSAAPMPVAVLGKPMPVRISANDRSETSIGAAQRDTAREWAAKAASLQPVMWAGIAMATVVAGALFYFGWWTKGAIAVGIGAAMIALSYTLPEHGTVILISGLGLFALTALLVLYAYHKGQIDQNNNGIPDVLENLLKKEVTSAGK